MRRTLVLMVASLALVANVCLIGTSASAGGSCLKPRFAAPESSSSNATDAPKEKVVAVTDKATEDAPVEIAYSHGPGIADQSIGANTTGDPQSTMLVEDARFFNFQVTSRAKAAVVNMRIEWGGPSPSDIDLRMFGQSGVEIDYSAGFNPAGGEAYRATIGGDDDNGMEQLVGVVMPRCSGFTVESRPAWSPGEDAVTLKVWLD